MRAALLALALSTAVTAQTDQPPRPKTPPAQTPITREKQVVITVEGCVDGTRLAPAITTAATAHEAVTNALYYRLEGSKELLRTLSTDHKGHRERITGIAFIPPTPAGTTVDTTRMKIGKGTLEAGVRESGGGQAGNGAFAGDAPVPIRLRVQEATHLDEKCVERTR